MHIAPAMTGEPGKAPASKARLTSAAVILPSLTAILPFMWPPLVGPVAWKTSVRSIVSWTGAAALAGEQRRDGLQVDADLPAEAAADLHGDDADAGDGQLEQLGERAADGERPLRARPDGQGAVGVPVGGAVVGLDVALVDHLRIELALDDGVGLGEGSLDIASLEAVVGGDVAGVLGLLAGRGLRMAALIEQRGIVAHRVLHVEDGRKHLVLDLDGLDGGERVVDVGGGDAGDGVTAVEGLVGGEHVLAHVRGRGGALTHVEHLVGDDRQVAVGHHSEDAGHGLGRARIDGEDARVRVGTAQDGALDEVGKVDVGAVERLARDLLDAIGADGTGADDLVVGLLGGCHAETSSISDALRTARTILS